MEWYLPVIWAALIGTAVALYVILDGFDLGVGILFPFAADEARARPDDELGRARIGTATRPGWCSAAADCGWRFRTPMR